MAKTVIDLTEGMLTGKKKYPEIIQKMLDEAETEAERKAIIKAYEEGGELPSLEGIEM